MKLLSIFIFSLVAVGINFRVPKIIIMSDASCFMTTEVIIAFQNFRWRTFEERSQISEYGL